MGVLRPLAASLCAMLVASGCGDAVAPKAPDPSRVPIAVLGDSDSHAFQDQISFPPGDAARGGPYRAVTLQWTEVLSRLRGGEVELGGWGVWGTRGGWARLPRLFGARPRVPKKQDHRFNFAWSGARCADLDEGVAEQLSPLLAAMDEAPDAWSRGVVVLRIGINDLGVREALDAFAGGKATLESEALVDACVAHIDHTVRAISAAHPSTAIVLVGVLDNTEWPLNLDRYAEEAERDRVNLMLDRFDAGLRAIAGAEARRWFIDDRRFLRARIGSRSPKQGAPLHSLRITAEGESRVVEFAVGDRPTALFLQEGHMGTALNGLWAQELVSVLHEELGLPVTPITDEELLAFLMPLLIAEPED